MNYFLCITTEENAKIVMDKKIWGVSKNYTNSISKVNLGDYLIIYEMGKQGKEPKPQYIKGIYEVVSEVKEDNKKLFESYSPNENYPLRIKLKEVKIFENPIIFRDLVQEMDFITNKKFWSGSLRRAMAQINESDYNKIVNSKQ